MIKDITDVADILIKKRTSGDKKLGAFSLTVSCVYILAVRFDLVITEIYILLS
jgi:hypothetical protein